MRNKKNILTSIFILLGLTAMMPHLLSQSTDYHLDEVRITGTRKAGYLTGLHTIRIDTVLKSKYFGSDLVRVLEEETNLNVTRYGGEGSLASIRMRGTGPSQTQFNWNGIPVNSPTTGAIDLSLLSAGEADAVEITGGAGGSLFGNGTFGGSVNLFNRPDWDNRFSARMMAETGSWKHFMSGLSLKTGTDSFQYQLSGVWQSSANRYSYTNTFRQGDPREIRQNDSLRMASVQQHLFFRLPGNWFIQYGAWLHNRMKQLPDALGASAPISATQRDLSLRQFARVAKWFRHSALEGSAACFADSLLYTETPAGEDSVTRSSGLHSVTTYLGINNRWFITPYITIEGAAETEIRSARTTSYARKTSDIRSSLLAAVRYDHRKIDATLSFRQVFYSLAGPKPLFSAAIAYRFPALNMIARAQVANKFRMPTLNDLYWQPGGNPDLLPESGGGIDLGFDWNLLATPGTGLSAGSTFFIQDISNWIQWVPSGAYWSPRNVREVICKGVELELSGKWTTGNVVFRTKTMYSYTESIDLGITESGDRLAGQLPYVPLHMLKVRASAGYGHFTATAGYGLTGRRFTTDDHDPFLSLDPVHLADLDLTYAFERKNGRLLASVRVSNLFNVNYQLIRAYPTPGRSFYLTLNYLFNKKKKTNVQN